MRKKTNTGDNKKILFNFVSIYLTTVQGSDDLKLWMNRGSTYESNVMPRDDISITKHGLKIPVEVSDYAEFVAKMKTHEQEFIQAFSMM